MKIKRKSPFTGEVNEMEIDVTKKQLRQWKSGELIQKAMPELSADERQFIKTGIMPQEWEDAFGK